MQNRSVIYNEKARSTADSASRDIISWLNAFGLVAGQIALNLWDFVGGGLTVAGVFSQTIEVAGLKVPAFVIGVMISLMLWFIQLLLWMVILEDGRVSGKDIPFVVLALVVAVVDTNLDTSAVYLWLTSGSVVMTRLLEVRMMGTSVAAIVEFSLVIAVYIAGFFGELFNAVYFNRRRPTSYSPATPARSSGTWKPSNQQSQSQPAKSSVTSLISPSLRKDNK